MAEKLVSKDKILKMLLEINDQLEVLEETLGIHADKEVEERWNDGTEIIKKAQILLDGTGKLLIKINRLDKGYGRKTNDMNSGLKPYLVRG